MPVEMVETALARKGSIQELVVSKEELRGASVRAGGRANRREGCPEPEQILALVEQAGPEPGRQATLEHVRACGACRREYDLLRSAPDGRAAAHRRRVVPLAAVLVVILLFLGTMLYVAFRSGTSDEAFLGDAPSVELVNPRGEARSRPISFIWRSREQTALYRLEVLTAAGDVVYTTETRDTAIALPGDVPLTTGDTYRWWVSVRTGDGREARSPVFSFTP